ncbi:hypothetical protein MKW92_005541 [Papaver armeniacum]|nr:hypothetical protein MKW92_005541 [Papaver armeniacum]
MKIERMKKSGSNFIKLMNVALKNLGQAHLLENALDPNEDSETEDERKQLEDEDDRKNQRIKKLRTKKKIWRMASMRIMKQKRMMNIHVSIRRRRG